MPTYVAGFFTRDLSFLQKILFTQKSNFFGIAIANSHTFAKEIHRWLVFLPNERHLLKLK